MYINNIYNNSYKTICRSTTHTPDHAITLCPLVPLSLCPTYWRWCIINFCDFLGKVAVFSVFICIFAC